MFWDLIGVIPTPLKNLRVLAVKLVKANKHWERYQLTVGELHHCPEKLDSAHDTIYDNA